MEISKNSCRICLYGPSSITDGTEWECFPLYENNSDISFAEKFSNSTGIRISSIGGYAQQICKKCLIFLKKVIIFIKICKRTELILQNYIKREKEKVSKHQNNEDDIEEKYNISDVSLSNSIQRTRKQSIKNNYLEASNENIEIDDDLDKFDTDSIDDPDYNLVSENKNIQQQTHKKLSRKIKRSKNKRKIVEENLNSNNDQSRKEEPSLICEICGNIFKKRHVLENHKKIHTDKKDFKCEICGKEFLLQTYLSNHIKTHTGIKNFSCSFCSRKFYFKGKMKAHEKIHRGECKYTCKICSRTFAYSQALKKHEFCHTGLKPHACPYCNKEFRTKCNLNQHLRSGVHKKEETEHQNSDFAPADHLSNNRPQFKKESELMKLNKDEEPQLSLVISNPYSIIYPLKQEQ